MLSLRIFIWVSCYLLSLLVFYESKGDVPIKKDICFRPWQIRMNE